jgi:hypothetical protein
MSSLLIILRSLSLSGSYNAHILRFQLLPLLKLYTDLSEICPISAKVSVHSRWYIISFILQQPTHIHRYQAFPDTQIRSKNINQHVTYISSPKSHSIARTNTTKNIELPTTQRRFGEYHKQSFPQCIINHSWK